MDRLAAMQTFVRVVETGSFSAATRYLNIGQPAVLKSIAHLENRLGVRLLARSTRRLKPTEAGRKFCERARRAIEEADEADLAARGTDAGLVGRLRVSAGVTFGKLHLVPRLPDFLAAHPDLSIDLILDDRTIDPIKEGIDVGLRFGPLPDSSLRARKVATSPRLVVGAPTYFERSGIPATPAELISHAAVIYTQDRGGSDTWSFRQGTSEMSVSISGRLRVSASEGLRAAVIGGMGLAITAPVDLCARVGVRRGAYGSLRMDLAGERPVGSVPDWPACERQGPRLRSVCGDRTPQESSGQLRRIWNRLSCQALEPATILLRSLG